MKQRGGRLNFSRGILENIAILYIVFILALLSLLYFAGTGDLNTTAVFVISAFVISFFSKNMIVIFIFTLVISYLYKYGINNMLIKTEGFTDTPTTSTIQDISGVKNKSDIKYDELVDKPLFNGSTLDIDDVKNKINTQHKILNDIVPAVNKLKMKDEIASASATAPTS